VNRYCSGHSQEPLEQLQHHAKRQDRRSTLTLILPILVNGKHPEPRPLSNAHIAWARDEMAIAGAKVAHAEITNSSERKMAVKQNVTKKGIGRPAVRFLISPSNRPVPVYRI